MCTNHYHSYQPIEYKGCGGVVSAVMERWNTLVLPAVVAVLKVCTTTGVQGSDRLSHTHTHHEFTSGITHNK